MKKNTISLFFLAILCAIFSACKKDDFSLGDLSSTVENSLQRKSSVLNLHNEAAVLEGFDDALNEMATSTVADLMSPSFQNTSEYIDLSNASIDLLQTADVLDSVKFHLNISDNADPRLILAAGLLNEMVKSPPSPDPLATVPRWLNCAVQAGIGISFETLRNLTAGGTLWHVGQAIKHMGYEWFAKTVGKTVGKVMTGFGGAMIVAEFTWCMLSENISVTPTEPGDETMSGPGGTLYTVELSSYLLPALRTSSLYYAAYASHLTDGESHELYSIPICFNSADNKYYSESSFVTFVPDGYYRRPQVGQYPQYYRIVNGVSIMLYELR